MARNIIAKPHNKWKGVTLFVFIKLKYKKKTVII